MAEDPTTEGALPPEIQVTSSTEASNNWLNKFGEKVEPFFKKIGPEWTSVGGALSLGVGGRIFMEQVPAAIEDGAQGRFIQAALRGLISAGTAASIPLLFAKSLSWSREERDIKMAERKKRLGIE